MNIPLEKELELRKYQLFPKGCTIFCTVDMHKESDLRQPRCGTEITMNLNKSRVVKYDPMHAMCH